MSRNFWESFRFYYVTLNVDKLQCCIWYGVAFFYCMDLLPINIVYGQFYTPDLKYLLITINILTTKG